MPPGGAEGRRRGPLRAAPGRYESCDDGSFAAMSTGDLGQEPNGHQSGVSVTAGAALARLAELERERRVGDALVQVAEQAGETLDLKSVLDRICRLTVELVPADRTTIYVSSKRVRAYVPIADYGTPAHVKQRMTETYYYGAKQAGVMRPMFVAREAMAAAGIVTWTRDDAPTPAALELLEEA